MNAEAVKLGVRAGLALSSDIAREAKFDRKQYFYADLPKGYQISQYDVPICSNGFVEIEVDGQLRRFGVTRSAAAPRAPAGAAAARRAVPRLLASPRGERALAVASRGAAASAASLGCCAGSPAAPTAALPPPRPTGRTSRRTPASWSTEAPTR
jgi:hypothetical protein